jgi:hypothetical protein
MHQACWVMAEALVGPERKRREAQAAVRALQQLQISLGTQVNLRRLPRRGAWKRRYLCVCQQPAKAAGVRKLSRLRFHKGTTTGPRNRRE